ncbi:MAG: amino acid adenylation domain-containing protein [Longimicrobiales bacterium]
MSIHPERTLCTLLTVAARRRPEQVAIEEPGCGDITYAALDALSDRVCAWLVARGVAPGDRVGLALGKSIDAVAAIFGILKAGGAYVPIDPGAPVQRSAYILEDCGVCALIVEEAVANAIARELHRETDGPAFLRLAEVGAGRGLRAALKAEALVPVRPGVAAGADGLAYILYTSGSTGTPKGVMLSHANALSFVDWCSEAFAPHDDDRFSSHAPLHFDLSILDLYVAIKHGATIVLIGAEAAKDPITLGAMIAERRITVWYSAPSILALLAQYGRLERQTYPALRTVLFAGEVFPVKHLRRIQRLWPAPRYFNLYGPTETNVCTWYEVAERVPDDRVEPYPIGRPCSHVRIRIIDANGEDVGLGEEGELCVTGAPVMAGYWNRPEQTERAFLSDADGTRWYRTGDVVAEDSAGDFIFLGRRDRMVKRRGYRIELGEIEAGLYRHPAIREAAAVATRGAEGDVRITAYLSCRDAQRPGLIELKRFCAEVLPLWMVPDAFAFVDTLPKTSTAKVDYQRLLEPVA